MFCDRQGRRIQNIREGFQSACEKAGIEDFRIHDLRHTCASLAIAAGAAAFFLSSQSESEPEALLPTREIIVAARPIAARQTIEALDLRFSLMLRRPDAG